jgi:MarR family
MDDQNDLPILPYPDKHTGRSSGWSGSDTSQERAEHDDLSGVTSRRQKYVLVLLMRARYRGLTWKELADKADFHHGQASGVLSNLHAAGLIERLADRRNKCHPYVLPDFVRDRETQPFKRKTGPTLADAWRQGFVAGSNYIGHGSPAAENPYEQVPTPSTEVEGPRPGGRPAQPGSPAVPEATTTEPEEGKSTWTPSTSSRPT